MTEHRAYNSKLLHTAQTSCINNWHQVVYMEDAYREFAAAAAMHHEQTSSAVANKFSGQHILQPALYYNKGKQYVGPMHAGNVKTRIYQTVYCTSHLK